jgi:hypothetical protein
MILIGVAIYCAMAALFIESLVWAASRRMPNPDDVRNEKHEYELSPDGSTSPASPLNVVLKLK